PCAPLCVGGSPPGAAIRLITLCQYRNCLMLYRQSTSLAGSLAINIGGVYAYRINQVPAPDQESSLALLKISPDCDIVNTSIYRPTATAGQGGCRQRAL